MSFSTARDAFDGLIRDRVAPGLREMGFKGSGASYALPDVSHWALLGFQRSRYNDRAEVRFTINLTVVARNVWDEVRQDRPYLPPRPASNTRYGTFVWSKRIGMLMPRGEDTWWSVLPTTDIDHLAREVLRSVRDYGLPALRERLVAG